VITSVDGSIEKRTTPTYREAVGEEDGAAGVGESHEELLLGQRIGGELPVRERGQVARQQAGPDGVGVGRGAKRRRDRGGAAGVPRRGPSERRRHEVLRQARDLAAGRRRRLHLRFPHARRLFCSLWIRCDWGEP